MIQVADYTEKEVATVIPCCPVNGGKCGADVSDGSAWVRAVAIRDGRSEVKENILGGTRSAGGLEAHDEVSVVERESGGSRLNSERHSGGGDDESFWTEFHFSSIWLALAIG